jgi:Ner family transcriptional regulator
LAELIGTATILVQRMKPSAQQRAETQALSGWHPEDVKAAVRKKGQTLAGLARTNHFSESYLRGTLIRPRPRGEEIIARFLGVAPREIWPDRYDTSGAPKPPRRK